MNKIERDLKNGREKRINAIAFLNILLDGIIYAELEDIKGKIISIQQKKESNTIDGRRGAVREESTKMGQSVKITNIKTGQTYHLEIRINEFTRTYYKGISGRQGDILLYTKSAFLILDKPNATRYALFLYSQIPDSCVVKGIKGKGNSKRINLNNLHIDPIPIEGWDGPLERKPSLQDALMGLF